MTQSEQAPTPEQRVQAWAEREATREAMLGGIPADRVDAYTEVLVGSFQGRGMALNFALDDLVEASGLRRLVGWLNDRLTRRR